METQGFAEVFSLLPERENPKEASVDGVPYILHEDHRWLLPIAHYAQQRGALPKPCTVIMFDRHHDALDPLKRSMDDLRRLRSAPTLEGVVSLCAEERLSKIDDDWLKAGMELGLFVDAVIFGVADRLSPDISTVYTDHNGDRHRIEMPYTLPRSALEYTGWLGDAFRKADLRNEVQAAWEILGWDVSLKSLRFVPGLPKVLLTIDLDCFAIEWSDYIFPWPNKVFEREFLQIGTHDWTGQRFFQELAKKAGLVTFARESGCCGGPEDSASILENLIHYGFGGGFSF